MLKRGYLISGFLFFAGLGIFQAWFVNGLGFSCEIAITDAAVSQALLLLICLSVIFVFSYYQPKDSLRINRLLIGLGFAFLYIFGLRFIFLEFFQLGVEFDLFLKQSVPIRFLISFLIIAFTVLCVWIWGFNKDEKQARLRKEELEKLKNEAELASIQQQIQPHFLFNSLNSITALIGVNPMQARKMTQQLSDFLRGTIKREEETQSLNEELAHLRLYLEIEKVRFGNRLEIKFEVEPATLERPVPVLLLQPIVENSIKFGLYGTIEEVRILFQTKIVDSDLQIMVSNPFDPQGSGTEKGTGFGLSSIKRRLQLIYHRNDLVKTESINNQFVTKILIPSSHA